MKTTNIIGVTMTAVLLIFSFTQSQASVTSEDFIQAFPDEIAELEEMNIGESRSADLGADGQYEHIETGATVFFTIMGGKSIIDFNIDMADNAARMNIIKETEVQDSEVVFFAFRNMVMAYAIAGDIVVLSGVQEGEEEPGIDKSIDILTASLESIDLVRLATWNPPGGKNIPKISDKDKQFVASAGASRCPTIDCFEEKFSECEDGMLIGEVRALNAAVRYEIDGRDSEGNCRVTFTFLDNPNPDWIGKNLIFSMDSSAPFRDQIEESFEKCIEEEVTDCEGSLMDEL